MKYKIDYIYDTENEIKSCEDCEILKSYKTSPSSNIRSYFYCALTKRKMYYPDVYIKRDKLCPLRHI